LLVLVLALDLASGSGLCFWFRKGGGIAFLSLALSGVLVPVPVGDAAWPLAAANRGALEGIPSMPNWYPFDAPPVLALSWTSCRSIIPSACS
jgi:hypothetical protein